MKRRCVVTGMGAVSCLGTGVPRFWEALVEGRCGIRPITRFSAANHRIQHAGEVEGFSLDPAGPDPAIQFLESACREALMQAEAAGGRIARERLGIVVATNFGAMESAARSVLHPAPAAEMMLPTSLRYVGLGGATLRLREEIGFSGPSSVLSLSCASGNAAIGYALDLIRIGAADAILACGFDAISELVWSGLEALRTMTTELLRPFDRRRDGTIFSEGAGALLLEAADTAMARGAMPLAEVLGHAMNNNAFHMAHPDKDGAGMARVMKWALEDAALPPEMVDHISAHGTGTKANDATETQAIKTVFGERAYRIPINAIKSMVGHAMGAASSLEAIAAIMTIRTGIVPPTIHLEEPDPECDLDYVPLKARECRVKYALSNSAGIGGANSAVLFGECSL